MQVLRRLLSLAIHSIWPPFSNMSLLINTSDTNRIQLRDFHGGGMWIYNLPESSRFAVGNPWSSSLPAVKEEEDSSASSSIGKL
ncbi:hypothetical protein Hanom_Chr17g01554211 [Helianthus anomalus]